MVPFLPICFYFGDSQDRPPSIFISSYFLFVCFVDSIWLAFDGGFAFCVFVCSFVCLRMAGWRRCCIWLRVGCFEVVFECLE